MILSDGKVSFLKRRYGGSLIPFFVVNSIIIFAACIRVINFGFMSIYTLGLGAVFAIFVLNLIPIYFVFDIIAYRIGVSKETICVRPLTKYGSYLVMRFADVDVVDLKALSALGNIANAKLNPAVIVLYRKRWDGDEIFALDPRRTNLRQFKDLVKMIFDRCPTTFSEDALRYLNDPGLMPPRGNEEGQIAWTN